LVSVSFLVEVADELAPAPGEGERGDVGPPSSSISDSGDLGAPPGWGVPPLEVVLRSWGEPTLLSGYLQVGPAPGGPKLGAGVRGGALLRGGDRALPVALAEVIVAVDEGGVYS